MNITEKSILDKFKSLLLKKIKLYKLFLFGSRAREDADPDSDMDVMVIVDDQLTKEIKDHISDCAWESCFGSGIILVPVYFARQEWEEGPEKYSLLAQAVEKEGILL